METSLSPELARLIGEDGFQFYRCYKCKELISAMELGVALKTNGQACPCGSRNVQPTQVRADEYVRSNVIEMAVHLKASLGDYIAEYLDGCPDGAAEVEKITEGWSRAKAVLG